MTTALEEDARRFMDAAPFGGSPMAGNEDFAAKCRATYGEEQWHEACRVIAMTRGAAPADTLTTAVKELLKTRAYQKGAWRKVIDESRAYFLMKTQGMYVEGNGNTVSVGHSRERMTEAYRDSLLLAVERACTEDALMGAAIADLT